MGYYGQWARLETSKTRQEGTIVEWFDTCGQEGYDRLMSELLQTVVLTKRPVILTFHSEKGRSALSIVQNQPNRRNDV
jgi:hypothetical protein